MTFRQFRRSCAVFRSDKAGAWEAFSFIGSGCETWDLGCLGSNRTYHVIGSSKGVFKEFPKFSDSPLAECKCQRNCHVCNPGSQNLSPRWLVSETKVRVTESNEFKKWHDRNSLNGGVTNHFSWCIVPVSTGFCPRNPALTAP